MELDARAARQILEHPPATRHALRSNWLRFSYQTESNIAINVALLTLQKYS